VTQTGEPFGEARVGVAGAGGEAGHQGDVDVLPRAPGGGGAAPRGGVGVAQESGVRGGQVPVALVGGNGGGELFVFGGEDPAHVPGHPGDFAAAAAGDGAEDHGADPVGVALGVGEPEGDAPADPQDHPPVDAQMGAERFEVGDEVVGGVVRKVRVGPVGQGAAAPAAALVEQHRPVAGGVEVAAREGG